MNAVVSNGDFFFFFQSQPFLCLSFLCCKAEAVQEELQIQIYRGLVQESIFSEQ